jgi:hypothetical protein
MQQCLERTPRGVTCAIRSEAKLMLPLRAAARRGGEVRRRDAIHRSRTAHRRVARSEAQERTDVDRRRIVAAGI